MLICYRNKNLAEMLENVKADTNSAALLQTVMRAIIELQKVAHQVTTVPLINCLKKGDSEVEKEEEKRGKKKEKAAVKKEEKRKKAVIKRVKEAVIKKKKAVMIEKEKKAAAVKRERAAAAVKDVILIAAI